MMYKVLSLGLLLCGATAARIVVTGAGDLFDGEYKEYKAFFSHLQYSVPHFHGKVPEGYAEYHASWDQDKDGNDCMKTYPNGNGYKVEHAFQSVLNRQSMVCFENKRKGVLMYYSKDRPGNWGIESYKDAKRSTTSYEIAGGRQRPPTLTHRESRMGAPGATWTERRGKKEVGVKVISMNYIPNPPPRRN